MLSAMLLGFLLGVRHAADPDHVAAVAALAARERGARSAAALGAAWALGHALVVLVAGSALVALRIAAAPSWTTGAEILVAAILVALGLANLARLRPAQGAAGARAPRAGRRSSARGAAAVGLAHGLAGSAAIALLALAAMPTPLAAAGYLALFALGSVVGMVGLSAGLGAPFAAAGRSERALPWVLGGSGAVSVAVGLYLALAVGRATDLL